MSDSVFLKVTSAFLVAGEIAKVGEIVEVSHGEAKDLLQRGKAVLATADDAPAVEAAEETPAPADSDPVDPVAQVDAAETADKPAATPKKRK